ncbi:MAG: hypothetical protein ACI86M_000085 [Saprospiraceae bacterium]|jgi:hypothetical protein
MKHITTTVTLLFVLFISISINAQTRQIGNFTGIKVSSSVSVKLVKADYPKIEYKMIKGDESALITEIKGSNLIVKIKSNFLGSNNTQAKVIVYYTELNDISVSAGASLKSDNPIRTQNMDIDVSSGSSADVEVIAQSVDLDASTAANVKLEGSAKKAKYDASSGSTINAKMMICDYVDADVSSGAKIKAHVNKKLNADASSGGSIRYTGDVDDTRIDKGWSGQISRM